MATVHFLYRSVREKSFLEVRLQHTENTVKYLWTAKTKIEVSKEYWTKYHKVNSRNVEIRNQQFLATEGVDLLIDFRRWVIFCFFVKSHPFMSNVCY